MTKPGLVRKVSRHPLATLVLSVLLVCMLAVLPSATGESVTANALRKLFRLPPAKVAPWSDHQAEALFWRRGGTSAEEWVRIEPNQIASGPPPGFTRADQLVSVALRTRSRLVGLFAPSTHRDELDMRLNSVIYNDSNRAIVDREQLRRPYAEFLASVPGQQKAAGRLLRGEDVQRSVHWIGVLHNIVMLILTALFVRSLAWVPETLRRIGRGRRAALLRRRSLCPNCKYSINGLTTQICPECGTALAGMNAVASKDTAAVRS